MKAKRVTKAISGLLAQMELQKYGLDILRVLVGDSNIFVMGEIFGIYPSFTTLQTHELESPRRYAGSSWGGLNKIQSPITKYQNEIDFGGVNNYVIRSIDRERVFGSANPLPAPDAF
jgi:hypothetical protein